ncbi:MAG: hydroxymethylbilane synthase [Alphaproteobacteria bacterium]
MADVKLRIGTRASPLAVAQAREVARLLAEAHGWDVPREDAAGGAVEIVKITTTGDRVRDRPLAAIGGKGLFTKEIEKALVAGEVDLAVHSMKDMPAELPPGLVIAAVTGREDPRDAFIGGPAPRLTELPRGAVIGTCSLRRKAQVLTLRPDFRVVDLRGNVQTRMGKVESGELAGTLLALAGLRRLGLERHASEVVAAEHVLPAIGQGTLCLETRADDERTRALLEAVHHAPTAVATAAERAFLARLGGSCRMPVAGLAEVNGEKVYFRGAVYQPDGSRAFSAERAGDSADAARMGRDAADEIRARAGSDFLAAFVAAQ